MYGGCFFNNNFPESCPTASISNQADGWANCLKATIHQVRTYNMLDGSEVWDFGIKYVKPDNSIISLSQSNKTKKSKEAGIVPWNN